MKVYINYFPKDFYENVFNSTVLRKAGAIQCIVSDKPDSEPEEKYGVKLIEYDIDAESFEEACEKLKNNVINLETLLPETSAEEERKQEKNIQLMKANSLFQTQAMNSFLMTLDDKEASKIPLVYQSWNDFEDGYEFKKDERCEYKEKLWKCLQNHDKQINREPDIAVSLWVIAYVGEYPEWKQPTGAHDAYNIGDKCSYEGKKYISKINGNTTVPGSDERYWEEVLE